MIDKSTIRPAATVIALRDFASDPKVLMGQRGAKAAFMPNKFVFPGGAVDVEDNAVALINRPGEVCQSRLLHRCGDTSPDALAVAAIREFFEETGLRIGTPVSNPSPLWGGFEQDFHAPDAGNLFYFFRALTPPGRPRRFDARFFLLDADTLNDDLDDFSAASDELSHLQWVPLPKVRALDLPFITSVVLAEVAGLTKIGPPPSVPFFENNDEESLAHRIGRAADLDR